MANFFDDFMRNVFGGSEQHAQQTSSQTSQGTSSSTSAASSTPSDLNPFANIRNAFSGTLTNLLSGGLNAFATPGPYVAPITGGETDVLSQLNNQTGPGTARAQYINDVLTGKYLPGQPGSNPFLDAAIREAQRPTLEGLSETLDRSLPGKFTQGGQIVDRGTGGGSSAFDRAAAIASRGAANALAGIATNLSAGNFEAERGRQNQAVALDQAEVDTTVKNLQAQALPRLIQDLGIQRGLDEFKTRIASLLQLLATLGGVTAANIAQTSTSTSQSQAQQTASATSQGTSEGISSKGIVPNLIEGFTPKPGR